MEDRLLSPKEVAQILGLSEKTIYMWKWRRLHLPFVKLGNCLRISEKDLQGAIYTNIEYAPYIEYGTRKMLSRPFLRLALYENKNNIVNIVNRELASRL